MADRLDIDVTGVMEFSRALNEIADEFKPSRAVSILNTPLRNAARIIADVVRNNTPVDTGALRESTDVRVGAPTKAALRRGSVAPDTVRVATVGWYWPVGTGPINSHVALAVEFGTRFKSATPVLVPALTANAAAAVEVFRRDLGEALERRARKIARRAGI